MSDKTYPSTARSGIGWLVDIPSHWAVLPAKALFALRSEKALPDDVHLTPSQKFGVLPQFEYMEITGSRVVLNLKDSGQMKHVEPNDFISHLRSFQGGLELSRIRGKVSGAYTVLKLRRDQNPDYWKYILKSDTYIQALQTTTDQLRDGQSIRLKEFAQIPLPLVPRVEQDSIVEYLDDKLTVIDQLIEKQSELQDSLRASARSFIFDQIALELKDPSGEGKFAPIFSSKNTSWNLAPFKSVCQIQKEVVGTNWASYQLLSLTRRGVIARDMHSGFGKFPAEFDGYQIVRPDDLVFCLFDVAETPRTVGRVEQTGMITSAYTRYKVNTNRADPKYLELLFIAIDDEKLFQPFYSGLRNTIPKNVLGNSLIPLPRLADQKKIVSVVNSRILELESLLLRVNQLEELLRQLRIAVIANAVLGYSKSEKVT